MANTVIEREQRSVRLPYWMLENAFATLAARLPRDDPARRLVDPWLAHIGEGLGYVLLDEVLLEDREGVRRLREVLEPLAEELERGEMPFPPHQAAKLNDLELNVANTAQTTRRLVTFLDEVIADQEAEEAGSKAPFVAAE